MYKFNIFSCLFVIIISLFSTYVFSAAEPLALPIEQSRVPIGTPSNKSEIASEIEHTIRVSMLRTSYSKAVKEAVHKNWNTKNIPKNFICKVQFTQAPGGIVIDVTFLDCPSDRSARRSVEVALRKEPLPYQGFEEVFSRRNITTFCISCEESKPIAEISQLQSLGTATLANDMMHKPTDITKLLIELRKKNPDQLRPLFTTGSSGEFSIYIMECLKIIALRVNEDVNFPLQMPLGASIMFSVLITPDGTVNAVQINMNTGTSELETILREAIKQSNPFPPFPEAMTKKHSAVLITHTFQYEDCKAPTSNCGIEL